MDEQANIVSAMLNADAYSHPVSGIQHVETHISHVFLTGDFAYKIKKPIVLAFLDFGTLDKRKFFCQRELELNQRFSRELYLEVIAIGVDSGKIKVGCRRNVVEYAVCMRQFPPSALFSELLRTNQLDSEIFRELGETIAAFHRDQGPLVNACPSNVVWQQFSENWPAVRETAKNSGSETTVSELLDSVEALGKASFERLSGLIDRRNLYAVRELHGDLHLGNICLFDNRPLLFDCLEFNSALSCCDVYSDLAFLLMDLRYRQHQDFATVVLNSYLKATDDWEGLQLLPLFESYRACVRAKVDCIKSQQHSEEREELLESAMHYLKLARERLSSGKPLLVSIGGLSGSGKTLLATEVAPLLSSLHLSSDVIRKHQLKIPLTTKAVPASYSAESRAAVYSELFKRAQVALDAGFSVIIDASFKDQSQRAAVERLASELGVNHLGIWCSVDTKLALERIAQRRASGVDSSDADESVLAAQMRYDVGEVSWHRLDTDNSIAALVQHVEALSRSGR